jgi:hypothetical protein
LLSLLAPRLIPDPCALISKADVQAFIGEPVANMAKEDPEPKTRMLFGRVQVGRRGDQEDHGAVSQDRDEDSTVESEPGLGDRAFIAGPPRRQ